MTEQQPSTEDILDLHVRVPERVVYRTFEEETLLLNLETSQYHGLNETGGRVLELIAQKVGTVREAVERLSDEYGVETAEIEPDIARFCGALLERGLLEVETDTEA